jgi:hypothetical protein
MSPDFIRQM